MPKIYYDKLISHKGRYSAKLKEYTKGITDMYEKIEVGGAAGLTQFGINRVVLKPGAATSLRHWHLNEDEFVIIISGTVILVDDNGDQSLTTGECAGFKAGDSNGHHIINKSNKEAVLFEIGTRALEETVYYSDLNLMVKSSDGKSIFTTKEGKLIMKADPGP